MAYAPYAAIIGPPLFGTFFNRLNGRDETSIVPRSTLEAFHCLVTQFSAAPGSTTLVDREIFMPSILLPFQSKITDRTDA